MVARDSEVGREGYIGGAQEIFKAVKLFCMTVGTCHYMPV